jgi:hypothetical protein
LFYEFSLSFDVGSSRPGYSPSPTGSNIEWYLLYIEQESISIFARTRSFTQSDWVPPVNWVPVGLDTQSDWITQSDWYHPCKHETQSWCVETRFHNKTRWDAIKNGFKTHPNAFSIWNTLRRNEKNFETRLNAVFVYNVLKRDCKKILAASQRVPYWNRVYTGLIRIWLNALKRGVIWNALTRDWKKIQNASGRNFCI